jgi:predicted PurR-regulated permease PerM
MGDRRQQARWLALLAAGALALYGCALLIRPFIGVLTWAVVLTLTFYPVHRRILAWTGRPNLAAFLSTLLVVGAVLLPVTLAVLAVAREVPVMVQSVQETIAALTSPYSSARRWLGQYVDFDAIRDSPFLEQPFEDLGGMAVVGKALGFVGGLAAGAAEALFVVYSAFYLFRDGETLSRWLPRVLPLEEAQSEELRRRAGEMIAASVYGVVVLAVLQGTLGGLAFWVLGLPNALVWGAVMILLSVIPMTGSFVVWAPAALYLGLSGDWGKALILTAWGLLVIGTIDNLLRPKVMGQKARMHELLLFFAVLGGLVVFGVAGLILGPVLVAVALSLLDIIRLQDRPAGAIRREPGLAEQTAEIADVSQEGGGGWGESTAVRRMVHTEGSGGETT